MEQSLVRFSIVRNVFFHKIYLLHLYALNTFYYTNRCRITPSFIVSADSLWHTYQDIPRIARVWSDFVVRSLYNGHDTIIRIGEITTVCKKMMHSVSTSYILKLVLKRLNRLHSMEIIYEPPHDKTNKMSAPSEDSDQPGHPLSLIRDFAVCLKKVWVLSSQCADSEDSIQTGRIPRLIWVFAGRTATLLVFVTRRLIYIIIY